QRLPLLRQTGPLRYLAAKLVARGERGQLASSVDLHPTRCAAIDDEHLVTVMFVLAPASQARQVLRIEEAAEVGQLADEPGPLRVVDAAKHDVTAVPLL